MGDALHKYLELLQIRQSYSNICHFLHFYMSLPNKE